MFFLQLKERTNFFSTTNIKRVEWRHSDREKRKREAGREIFQIKKKILAKHKEEKL
jgi:hypothetical protein